MPTYEQPSQAHQHVLVDLAYTDSPIGTGDLGSSTPDFYIKLMKARIRSGSRLWEITGDGDTQETYLNNKLLGSTFLLSGAMIASQAVGIANIVGSANPALTVVFNLGGAKALTGNWMVEYIDYDWDRKSPFIGIIMNGKTSGVQMTERAAVTST